MQVQIQALIAGEVVAGRGSNVESHMKVARPSIFSEEAEKVAEFIMVCKLYLRIKIRKAPLEEQIQSILLYVQGGSVDVWKENVLEDLEGEILEYEIVGKFFVDIRKEFRGGNEEVVKMVELKRLEQGRRTMEEFVQEFRRAVRGSEYEKRLLIEEFKRELNRMIRRKLIEAKRLPTSIEQWYECVTNI